MCCSLSRRSSSIVYFTLAIATLFFILPLEISNAILWDKGVWIKLYGPDGLHNPKWCEAVNPNQTLFMIEPVNARSTYAYITFGCWLLVLGTFDLIGIKEEGEGEESPSVSSNTATFLEADEEAIRRTTPPREESLRTLEDSSSAENDSGVLMAEDGTSSLSHQNHSSGLLEEEEEEEEGEELGTESRWVKVPNPMLQYPHITITNGVFNILHGLGSFWYHACQCPGGGTADVAGMLSVISFPLWYMPLLLVPRKYIWCSCCLSFLPAIGQSLLWILNWIVWIRLNIFVTLAVSLIIGLLPLIVFYLYCWVNKRSEGGTSTHHKLKIYIYFVGIPLFFLGYFSWVLDNDKIWCFEGLPLSLLQGHAFWHFFTCGALVYVYLLFRTQEIREERPN